MDEEYAFHLEPHTLDFTTTTATKVLEGTKCDLARLGKWSSSAAEKEIIKENTPDLIGFICNVHPIIVLENAFMVLILPNANGWFSDESKWSLSTSVEWWVEDMLHNLAVARTFKEKIGSKNSEEMKSPRTYIISGVNFTLNESLEIVGKHSILSTSQVKSKSDGITLGRVSCFSSSGPSC